MYIDKGVPPAMIKDQFGINDTSELRFGCANIVKRGNDIPQEKIA
jgi:hypothetical protein